MKRLSQYEELKRYRNVTSVDELPRYITKNLTEDEMEKLRASKRPYAVYTVLMARRYGCVLEKKRPLLRDEVREDIAADLAELRKDENLAKRMEKNGEKPDAKLNDQIEQGKREVLEKIRKNRR